MKLQIDPEFRDACPPLTPGEYELLEADVLKNGVRDPILHWKGIVVDGHNRYGIALKHGISFQGKPMNFTDRAEALTWIIRNQIARRNLSKEQIKYLWGKHFATLTMPSFDPKKPAKSIRAVAKESGVPRTEVKRAIKFAKEVDDMPAEKRKSTLAGKERRKPKEAEPEKPVITQASEGRIPIWLRETAESKALPKCLSLIDEIIATIKKAANDDTGAWLATGPLMIALDQARACIAAGTFFDICPECNARKGGCDDCRRTGWVPRFRYDELCGVASAQTVSGRGRR